MYSIDCTKFERVSYSGVWWIEIDISQLRNFNALDIEDAIIISRNYELDLNTCKSLIKQSDTTFRLAVEGERVPILLSVNAFKLGRILAQNSEYIQLENDVPPEVSDEIANGMLYELEQEQPKSTMLASHHFKFKMNWGKDNLKPTETSINAWYV